MERQVYQALIEYHFSHPAALCSILSWKGSVPRKDYPIMLVQANGSAQGTIGGGNMEQEVIQSAQTVIGTQKPLLKCFDFTGRDTNSPHGLCGGVLHVLIEPYAPTEQVFWQKLTFQREALLLTTYNTESMTVQRQVLTGKTIPENLPLHVQKLIQTVRETGESHSQVQGKRFVLVKVLTPPALLHIFGAGHIGRAVADLAHFVDLDVAIYDDRDSFLNRERFLHALCLTNAPLEKLPEQAHIKPWELVLVATRGHQYDLKLLQWLLKTPPAWIGLVSSQRKWKILRQTLLQEGMPEKLVTHVEAPVGVDIHAETVPEIAVSILGSIIKFLNTHHRSNAVTPAPPISEH